MGMAPCFPHQVTKLGEFVFWPPHFLPPVSLVPFKALYPGSVVPGFLEQKGQCPAHVPSPQINGLNLGFCLEQKSPPYMDSVNCFSLITGNTLLPGNSFYMLELFHLEVLNSSQTVVSKRGICCFILVKGPWVHFSVKS